MEVNKSEIESYFKEKNINRFFKVLFPFDKEYNAAIANEVLRLCSLLSTQYIQHFEEEVLLTLEAKKNIIETPPESILVLEHITQNKQLGVHFIPAFICSTLLRTSYNKHKFDQYKALALLVIARLSYMGEHDAKIKSLCDEIRLFSLGKRETLAGFLPDIGRYNFSELVKLFNSLVDESSPTTTIGPIRNQLEHYNRPLKASHDFSRGYHRYISTQRFRQAGSLTIKPKEVLNDEGDQAIEISQLHFGPKHSESWQNEDSADNDSRSINIVTSTNNTSKSEALAAIQARTIFAQIKKKAMHLPCDIYATTELELTTLLETCVNNIIINQETDISKLLLLMLLTGSNDDQVKRFKPYRNDRKHIIGILRKHTLPSHSIRDELKCLTQPVESSICLPLPNTISSGLSSFKFKNIDKTSLKNFLQAINNSKGTHLTLTKISGYLHYHFSQLQIDPVITHIISGTDIKVLPALYYTQLPLSTLLNHYQQYLEHLALLINTELLSINPTDKEYLIGTTLHFDDKKLTLLFRALKKQIQKYQAKTAKQFSEQAHNDITVITQLVLMLATGYRPVSGWFGKRVDFHLPTKSYWIADKASSIGDNSRCIILPSIAINYLQDYIDYLRQAIIYHENQSPEIYDRYNDCLNNQAHFFFFRQENKILEVLPSNYTHIIDSTFPMQPNWARHHVRSLLFKHNIAPELISAWIGHQDMAKPAFNAFSQLSRKQLQQISEIINQHLIEIGLGD